MMGFVSSLRAVPDWHGPEVFPARLKLYCGLLA